jgi:hypothetical protein
MRSQRVEDHWSIVNACSDERDSLGYRFKVPRRQIIEDYDRMSATQKRANRMAADVAGAARH